MRKIVVINSTPLISLGNIDALWILKELYGEVLIPEAVYNEIMKKSDSASASISTEPWVIIKKIEQIHDRKMYQAKLHDGEVEVMILSQELKADLTIIDDNAAKKAAQYLGINVIGTMGVLLKAKETGIIDNVRQYLDQLSANDFYVSSNVRAIVLELAGE